MRASRPMVYMIRNNVTGNFVLERVHFPATFLDESILLDRATRLSSQHEAEYVTCNIHLF